MDDSKLHKKATDDSWMNGLVMKGLCYEGIVEDVDTLLDRFQQQTVTSWGTRTSTATSKEVMVRFYS